MKREIKIDQIFGYWTVIDLNPIKIGSNLYLKCRCVCKKEQLVSKSRILTGKTKCCKSCSPGIYKQCLGKGRHKGVGYISKEIFKRIKRHSMDRRRNYVSRLPFTITIEYIWELFQKQEGKCKISGIPLILHTNLYRVSDPKYYSYVTASLDRIDSSKGYIPGNVQWVHKWVNIMKNSMTDDQLKYVCSVITEHNKDNFEPSLVDIDFLNKVTRKVQRLTDEDTISNNSDTRIRHPQSEDDDIV